MAYSPPNTFVASSPLDSEDVQDNNRALRVYLHKGIVSTDLQSSPAWIRTGHIQPPIFEPWQGVQHGVSGHMVSQWGGGESVRLSFVTSYLSGGGLAGVVNWAAIPGTSCQIQIRRAARCLFHWWCEVEHGPDTVPYVGNLTGVVEEASQPGQNHQLGWNSTLPPVGAIRPYTTAGGYGQRDGVLGFEQPLGTLTIGLAAYSQIDRCGVVNWGFNLETFYL